MRYCATRWAAPIYLRTVGPTQLAYREREVIGHGVQYHTEGFGSPIGQLKDFSRCLSEYTIDELKAHDIAIGQRVKLEYLSGVTVDGVLKQVHRQDHRNLILSLGDCRVTDLSGRILFDPTWGAYDLAVGSNITSVYGGVADREKLQLYKPTPGTETIRVAHDARLMDAYALVDGVRCGTSESSLVDVEQVLTSVLDDYPAEWLLRAELLNMPEATIQARTRAELELIGSQNDELRQLAELALGGQ